MLLKVDLNSLGPIPFYWSSFFLNFSRVWSNRAARQGANQTWDWNAFSVTRINWPQPFNIFLYFHFFPFPLKACWNFVCGFSTQCLIWMHYKAKRLSVPPKCVKKCMVPTNSIYSCIFQSLSEFIFAAFQCFAPFGLNSVWAVCCQTHSRAGRQSNTI